MHKFNTYVNFVQFKCICDDAVKSTYMLFGAHTVNTAISPKRFTAFHQRRAHAVRIIAHSTNQPTTKKMRHRIWKHTDTHTHRHSWNRGKLLVNARDTARGDDDRMAHNICNNETRRPQRAEVAGNTQIYMNGRAATILSVRAFIFPLTFKLENCHSFCAAGWCASISYSRTPIYIVAITPRNMGRRRAFCV